MELQDNWLHYVNLAFGDMISSSDTRELGKLLAIPSEYFQRDKINDETTLSVARREDVEDCDRNQSGYDLLSEGGLRIQCKFRSKSIHLENTRRNSKKNQGAASISGHVQYSVDECDVFCFTRPNNNYEDTRESRLLAIPAADLEDPKNPGFIRSSVPKSMEREYEGRAREILESLERRQLNKNN